MRCKKQKPKAPTGEPSATNPTETHAMKPETAVPITGQPVDGLALWNSEGGAIRGAPLSAIRLDGNEHLLIPFTIGMLRVLLHYMEYLSIQSYVHCSGADCLLCRLGRQADTRDLLPVYDVVNKVVGVLAISPSQRPNALRPQLAPILQHLKQRSRMLVGIRKPDKTRFVVTTYDLPEGADDGADVILNFKEEFDAGRIDLGSVFPRLSNKELAAVPEVATMMTVKGIELS